MEITLKKIVLGLCLLCGIATLIWASFSLDAPVRAAVVRIEGANWDHSLQKTIVGSVSRYGDWPELMALGVIGFVIARKSRSLKWQRIFLIAMVASTLAGTLVNTLRLTTGRTRPRVSPAMEQAWYGPYHEGKWTIGHAECNSFPSGHTATAVAFAGIIFFGSPFWGIVALFLAALVASSRVLLGAHHPSDLIAATLLSFVLAWWLWKYRDHVVWNKLFKLH